MLGQLSNPRVAQRLALMQMAQPDATQSQQINTLPPVDDTFTKSSTTGREHWLPSTDYPQRTRMDVALGGDLPPEPTFSEVPLSPADLRGLVRALGSMAKRSHPALVAAKKWYHGSASDLNPQNLDPIATKSAGNLFGPGIYLTDNAAQIPQGYAKSSAASLNRKKYADTPRGLEEFLGGPPAKPNVYEARVQPRKILDLEEPAPKNVLDIFEEIAQSLYDGPDMIDGELRAVLDHGLTHDLTKADRFTTIRHKVPPKVSTEELYDALKADMHYPGEFLRNEADELFFNIAEGLRGAGYDALTHTGGLRTGNKPHQVLIMLDPNDYYNVRGMSSLEGPAGISKQPFLPGGEVSSFEVDQWQHIKPSRFADWPMFEQARKK